VLSSATWEGEEMATLNQFPRGEKLVIARSIRTRLADRKAKGPPEPGLDPYIDELDDVAGQLEIHVTGKTTADAARTALDDAVDAADDKVDTTMRHIHAYLDIEARSRRSPHALAARAVYEAAFPDGLSPIDDHVIDQNIYCRAALDALRAPEHQAVIAAIELPMARIDGFEAALKASESAMDQLMKARGDKSAHVGMGRDAELAWVDLMVRLRRQLASRVKRGDVAKQIENKQLLEPLLVAIQKVEAMAAARATRKKGKQESPAQPSEDSAGAPPAETLPAQPA
jgi:hypothetical protein